MPAVDRSGGTPGDLGGWSEQAVSAGEGEIIMDSDAREPQAPEPQNAPEPQSEPAVSGQAEPADAADEVLEDEIESIRAIGEDQ